MKNKIKIVKINDLNALHSDTECSEYYGNGFEINQDAMLINGRPFNIAYAGYYYTDEGGDRVDGETILDAV